MSNFEPNGKEPALTDILQSASPIKSPYRVMSHGRRHGRTQYYNALKEAAERRGESPAIPTKADEISEIAIDECKEMTREDFEKIKDHPLLGKVECDIQTDKHNDWFFREVTGQFVEDTNEQH